MLLAATLQLIAGAGFVGAAPELERHPGELPFSQALRALFAGFRGSR